MSLQVKNQVIGATENKIPYWMLSERGKCHYHIGVWIDGSDGELNRIDRVEYLLNPTFTRPLRRSSNLENKFGITFWTWGMFNIQVELSFKDGTTDRFVYYLTYSLPEDDGSNYIRVER
jgi:transcription initiation factor IIF auxiliary subunit